MKYVLQIWFQGECIEDRKSDTPFWPEPLPGEQIRVEFQNPYYNEEHGLYWIVRKRRHLLLFPEDVSIRGLQLYCEPDPAKGDSDL